MKAHGTVHNKYGDILGMKLKRSCEHTVIRNCLLDKGHGGMVIGQRDERRASGYGSDPVPDGPHDRGLSRKD